MRKLLTPLKSLLKGTARRLGYTIVSPKSGYFGYDVCLDIANLVPSSRIKTICDVGANVGRYALQFQQYFPSAAVFAFEPVKATFQELELNTRKCPTIKCYNVALSNAVGQEVLFHQPHSEWNTLAKPLNAGTAESVSEMVEVSTVDAVLGPQIDTIEILKTDTEGLDLEVLQGAQQFLSQRQVAFVYSEVGFHAGDARHTVLFDLNTFLADYGFRFVALYEQVRFGNYGQEGYANALFAHPDAIQQLMKANG
jgi:FkbM family methyltransferase